LLIQRILQLIRTANRQLRLTWSSRLNRFWQVVVGISVILGLWLGSNEIADRYFKEHSTTISILSDPVHLGDNYHADIGGDESLAPKPTGCDQPFGLRKTIVCLDKAHGVQLGGSLTSAATDVWINRIAPEIQGLNLDAWRHIALVESAAVKDEERKTSVDFGSFQLVWRRNAGNYYTRYAAVMIAFQTALFDLVTNAGFDIKDFDEVRITYFVEGLTGGRRPDQQDRIHVFFENQVKRIEFPTSEARGVRTLRFDFDLDIERIGAGEVVNFGVFTLPWEEKRPVPSPGTEYDPRGPAHFQDFDINKIYAKITLD
jgi:hypothetical protein